MKSFVQERINSIDSPTLIMTSFKIYASSYFNTRVLLNHILGINEQENKNENMNRTNLKRLKIYTPLTLIHSPDVRPALVLSMSSRQGTKGLSCTLHQCNE